MVEYNIVKHCRGCRKRFVVSKSEAKKNFCKECESKYKNGTEVKK